jgi:hypothetical protein
MTDSTGALGIDMLGTGKPHYLRGDGHTPTTFNGWKLQPTPNQYPHKGAEICCVKQMPYGREI